MKNSFKRILLTFIFSALKKLQKKQPNGNFLVISTTALGDSIWSTPFIQGLKENIDILASSVCRTILYNNPYVDNIILFDKRDKIGSFCLIARLLRSPYEEVYHLHSSDSVIPYFGYLAFTKKYIAPSQSGKTDKPFTDCVPVNRTTSHEATLRLELLKYRFHNLKKNINQYPLSVYYDQEDINTIQQLNLNSQKSWIIIHPGAAKLWRRWPAENFIQLSNAIIANYSNCLIIVTGSETEKTLVNNIATQVRQAIPLFNINLRAMVYLMSRAILVVTNDTGPLHLAAAAGTPIVGLFSTTSAIKTAYPYTNKPYQLILASREKEPASIDYQEVKTATLQLLQEYYPK